MLANYLWLLNNYNMELELLTYPRKSHRKSVSLPLESKELAELLGIIYGDGAIGNNWQLVISLNSIKDAHYAGYVSTLIEQLFSISPVVRKRPNQNTLVVVLTSTTIIDYLVQKGAVRGRKLSSQHTIPEWIYRKEEFLKYFIRGLVDTDGCIYLHRHRIKEKNYVNIGLCFTNYSQELTASIAEVIKNNNIKAYVTDHGKRIYLYSASAVESYLLEFGSSNKRILDKYNEWRDAGVV
jgi:intein/homing endonuclease